MYLKARFEIKMMFLKSIYGLFCLINPLAYLTVFEMASCHVHRRYRTEFFVIDIMLC
jgi:hypothetical protein